MKRLWMILFSVLLCFIFIVSPAQEPDTLDIRRNIQGVIKYAQFKQGIGLSMQNDTSFLKSVLHAGKDDSFRLLSTVASKDNERKKYQQYYKGLRVEKSEYIISGKNGQIYSIAGDFKVINISSVEPAISEEDALKRALSYVNSKKYKWEDESYEKFIKERRKDPVATYYPKGELVIAKGYLGTNSEFRVAWKFTVSSLVPDNAQLIFIDALSGEVINDTPLIKYDNYPGTAESRYNSQVTITCDSFTNGYRLRELRSTTTGNQVIIHTKNTQNTSNITNAIEFDNISTNWITGSWPAINQDQAALDVHWGLEKVTDYWSTVRGRSSLDDTELDILGFAHYMGDPGDEWPNNAAWNSNDLIIAFGDGDGMLMNPLVTLDIVAHEMGHGINYFTANLDSNTPYNNEECDALNEGLSDIWGAVIEYWTTPGKQRWLMGEDAVIFPFSCIRNLQTPMDPYSYQGPSPDSYQGSYWDVNGDCHINSTVLGRWFYLLTTGGSGWNDGSTSNADFGFGYYWSVAGVGIEDAARLVYIVQKNNYLTSSDDYPAFRQATIDAAIDTFGVNSCQAINTINAWYAVGIGNQFHYSNVTISGNSPVCTSGTTFTVNNLPTGCGLSWDQSSNLTLFSSTGNTAVFKANSEASGSGWVKAYVITPGCYNMTPVPQKDIWVGYPPTPSINATLKNMYSYYEMRFQASIITGVTYQWKINGDIQSCDGAFCSMVAPQCGGNPPLNYMDYNVEVSATNDCGSRISCKTYRFSCNPYPALTYVGFCPGGGEEMNAAYEENTSPLLSIYPNPNNGVFIIDYWSKDNEVGITEILVTDNIGRPIIHKKYANQKTVDVNLTNQNTGIYFLRIYDGNKWTNHEICINR